MEAGMLIGLASSLLTQVLKVFPALAISDQRKRLVALVVSIVASVGYSLIYNTFDASDLATTIVAALSTSFVVYKAVIQPVAEMAASVGKMMK